MGKDVKFKITGRKFPSDEDIKPPLLPMTVYVPDQVRIKCEDENAPNHMKIKSCYGETASYRVRIKKSCDHENGPDDAEAKPRGDEDAIPSIVLEALEFTIRSYYMIDIKLPLQYVNTRTPLHGIVTAHGERNMFWIQLSHSSSKKADPFYALLLHRGNLCAPPEENVVPVSTVSPELKEGSPCFAKYTDGAWYRAVVLQVLYDRLNRRSYHVFFVDYGNSEMVGRNEVRSTVQSHFSVPIQVSCCRLYNIKPRGQNTWSDMHTKLLELADSIIDKQFLVLVKRVHTNHVIDVDLFYNETGEVSGSRKHVANELVQSGIASYVDPNAAFFFH